MKFGEKFWSNNTNFIKLNLYLHKIPLAAWIHSEYEIEIVYIQPNNPYAQENVITFKDIAEIVERHGDPVSIRFVESLRRWADTKAGD
jgi:hypothetical protein